MLPARNPGQWRAIAWCQPGKSKVFWESFLVEEQRTLAVLRLVVVDRRRPPLTFLGSCARRDGFGQRAARPREPVQVVVQVHPEDAVEVEERLLPRLGVSRWSHQEHTYEDRYAHGAETMEDDGRLENPREARPLNLWV